MWWRRRATTLQNKFLCSCSTNSIMFDIFLHLTFDLKEQKNVKIEAQTFSLLKKWKSFLNKSKGRADSFFDALLRMIHLQLILSKSYFRFTTRNEDNEENNLPRDLFKRCTVISIRNTNPLNNRGAKEIINPISRCCNVRTLGPVSSTFLWDRPSLWWFRQ